MTRPGSITLHTLAALAVMVTAAGAPAAALDRSGQRPPETRDVRIVDLGVTSPDTSSWATDVSDSGVVLGGRTISFGPFTTAQAWRWEDGEVTHLEGVGQSSTVTDVNARGDAAGYVVTELERSRSRAVLWDRGTPTGLGAPHPEASSIAVDVNRRGEVLVRATWNDDDAQVQRWYVLDGTDAEELPVVLASGRLTDRGEVVGTTQPSFTEEDPFPRAVMIDDGVVTDLGTLGQGARVTAVNERGQAVGASTVAGGPAAGFEHAALFDDREVVDLGTLGGPGSEAADIYCRGRIVGTATVDDSGVLHAVMWTVDR